MKDFKAAIFLALCLVLTAVAVGAASHTWNGGVFAYADSGKEWYRIQVHDYAGVCVYVALGRGRLGGYASGDASYPAIAVVPKTQLPKDAGCQ